MAEQYAFDVPAMLSRVEVTGRPCARRAACTNRVLVGWLRVCISVENLSKKKKRVSRARMKSSAQFPPRMDAQVLLHRGSKTFERTILVLVGLSGGREYDYLVIACRGDT